MARISMNAVAHQYPATPGTKEASPYALKPLNIEWEDGGAYALLGPSGCGKTTLLNILSGLLVPSEGHVMFDDVNVTTLAPQERNIAQVFQFPVIYDTMTVGENLEFPLRNQKIKKRNRGIRVAEVMELLEITHLKNARARNLSADEKQKVSLGRGLVRTDTNAVLFDEPLTVIDPALKWQLRAQLKKIHQRIGQTMVYVTHDQTEALTFADQVVVMLDGEVLQTGTPQALFEQPEHTFVGSFIGSPGMNIAPCTVIGNRAEIEGQSLALNNYYDELDVRRGGVTELGIRPEHVNIVARAENPNAHSITITKVDDIGREKIVHFLLGTTPFKAVVPERHPLPTQASAYFDPNHLHIYRDSRRVTPSVAMRNT